MRPGGKGIHMTEIKEPMGPGDLPKGRFGQHLNLKVVKGWLVLDRPSADRDCHILQYEYELSDGRIIRLI
jgi:hypothetical protein